MTQDMGSVTRTVYPRRLKVLSSDFSIVYLDRHSPDEVFDYYNKDEDNRLQVNNYNIAINKNEYIANVNVYQSEKLRKHVFDTKTFVSIILSGLGSFNVGFF